MRNVYIINPRIWDVNETLHDETETPMQDV